MQAVGRDGAQEMRHRRVGHVSRCRHAKHAYACEGAQARGGRMDASTLALQQHGEDRAEREVRWLEELINAERRSARPPLSGDAGAQASTAEASPAAYPSPIDPTHPETAHTQNKE